MEPLSVVGGIASMLGIAQALMRLHKKLRKYRGLFKLAKEGLRTLSHEILQYSNVLTHAHRELEDDESLSPAERENLDQVLIHAWEFERSIKSFVRRQRRKFRIRRDSIAFVRAVEGVWLGRQWKPVQSQLALLKWKLTSSKLTLQLLITVFCFSKLKEILRELSKTSEPGSRQIERVIRKLESFKIGAKSIQMEIKTNQQEFTESIRPQIAPEESEVFEEEFQEMSSLTDRVVEEAKVHVGDDRPKQQIRGPRQQRRGPGDEHTRNRVPGHPRMNPNPGGGVFFNAPAFRTRSTRDYSESTSPRARAPSPTPLPPPTPPVVELQMGESSLSTQEVMLDSTDTSESSDSGDEGPELSSPGPESDPIAEGIDSRGRWIFNDNPGNDKRRIGFRVRNADNEIEHESYEDGETNHENEPEPEPEPERSNRDGNGRRTKGKQKSNSRNRSPSRSPSQRSRRRNGRKR